MLPGALEPYNRAVTEQPRNPIERFQARLERARADEPFSGTACVLATANAEGAPSARYVLLKGVDARGFAFYTNFESRKARELAENSRAALVFHWLTLGEQVRIEGTVQRVSDDEADAYFATRPRGSQLGAWASQQSRPVASRAELEAAYEEVVQRFEDQPVPRPSFWGGYLLEPTRIEFWKDQAHRLHDRFVYDADGQGGWTVTRLFP